MIKILHKSVQWFLQDLCQELGIKLLNGILFISYLVSFLRVVIPSKEKDISGLMFKNFGSHLNNYPSAYLTVASAIGVTKNDIDIFIKKLDKIFSSLVNKSNWFIFNSNFYSDYLISVLCSIFVKINKMIWNVI